MDPRAHPRRTTLPLTPRVREALDAICPPRGLLFGKHLLTGALRTAAGAAGLTVDEARRVSNHAFRHARATYLASKSDNLFGVAFLLGDKHISTTAIYAKPRQRAARDVLTAVADAEPAADSGGVVVAAPTLGAQKAETRGTWLSPDPSGFYTAAEERT